MRTTPVAEQYCSAQPYLPQLQGSVSSLFTVKWPISPPAPWKPEMILPSMMMPPPTPVPRVIATASLGYGLASIINILAPEIMVIGGGVSHEGENLLKPLVAEILPQLYVRDPAKQTRIVLATLGNDAGLIGAAFLGKQESL